MRQLTPGVKRLGIEFDHVNLDFRRQLEAVLAGVESVDIGKPSMWMRAIKSAEARMIGEEFVGATATIYFETGDGQEIRIQKSHEELADLPLAVGPRVPPVLGARRWASGAGIGRDAPCPGPLPALLSAMSMSRLMACSIPGGFGRGRSRPQPVILRRSPPKGGKTAQGRRHRRRQNARHHRERVVQEPPEMGGPDDMADAVARIAIMPLFPMAAIGHAAPAGIGSLKSSCRHLSAVRRSGGMSGSPAGSIHDCNGR